MLGILILLEISNQKKASVCQNGKIIIWNIYVMMKKINDILVLSCSSGKMIKIWDIESRDCSNTSRSRW